MFIIINAIQDHSDIVTDSGTVNTHCKISIFCWSITVINSSKPWLYFLFKFIIKVFGIKTLFSAHPQHHIKICFVMHPGLLFPASFCCVLLSIWVENSKLKCLRNQLQSWIQTWYSLIGFCINCQHCGVEWQLYHTIRVFFFFLTGKSEIIWTEI